jgi:predicted nucleic acid-binding protein
MRLCFDTNVVLDILSQRDDFKFSFAAYDVASLRHHEQLLPMFCATDIFYLLSKMLNEPSEPKQAMAAILDMFTLIDGHQNDCETALVAPMEDYEDAVLACAAKRNGADLIITRNKRDFANSPVPAMTPREYVELYKPQGIDYAVART